MTTTLIPLQRQSVTKSITKKNSLQIYPISTLPEHLHSTLLRYAKTTGKHTKSKETSFHPSLTLVPLLANHPHSHYLPLTGGPPNTHPFLVILSFGTPGDGCAPGSLLLCCVHSAHKVTKLPVFSCLLPFIGYFHVHFIYKM